MRVRHTYYGTYTIPVGAKAKLTAEQVKIIKGTTTSAKELAEDFKVSRSTISKIRHGKTWRNCGS